MKCFRCDWPYAYIDMDDGEVSGDEWIPGMFNCKNCDLEVVLSEMPKNEA